MDTDWCLTCNRHLDASSSLYCSLTCRCIAGPSRLPDECESSCADSVAASDDVEQMAAHHYTGNDYDGISAWAAAVVPGAPVQEQSRPPSMHSTSSRRSSISNSSRKSISTVTCRPPDLLRPHRPLPPTLCVSVTKPTSAAPSQPIRTLQPAVHPTTSAAYSNSTDQTESSLATPASDDAMPFSDPKGTVLEYLQSWVAPSPFSSTPHSPADLIPTRFRPPFASKPELKTKPCDPPLLRARGRASSRAKA